MSRRRRNSFAYVLVMSAGYVDGYGLFAFGTFLSFMSGNTTQTGYDLGRGRFGAAVPGAAAIAGFVIGATVGSTLSRDTGARARRLVLIVVAALESMVMLLANTGAISSLALVAMLSAAMGILNRAVTHIGGQSVSLTFVTGTLSQLAAHVSSAIAGLPLRDATDARDTHARRSIELAGVWCCFLAGAVLGGLAAPRLAAWTLAPSVVVLIGLAILPISRAPSPSTDDGT
ncbi:MAG TPA: YoaK family protein [Gemmatimonadaceae bacterium]|nr:YoaK family protein [Gemmatimonadaceae bacterium]